MKQALLFTLSFVALTVLLTWAWVSGGDVLYAKALRPFAHEIYNWLGISGRGSLVRTRFINIVPFTSLMLLTPGLRLGTRFGRLGIGWLILALSHIALNGFAMASRSTGQLPPVAALASDAMPFLLWSVFAREFVRETIARVRNTTAVADSAEQDHEESGERPASEGLD
jgi:hypothetical protein